MVPTVGTWHFLYAWGEPHIHVERPRMTKQILPIVDEGLRCCFQGSRTRMRPGSHWSAGAHDHHISLSGPGVGVLNLPLPSTLLHANIFSCLDHQAGDPEMLLGALLLDQVVNGWFLAGFFSASSADFLGLYRMSVSCWSPYKDTSPKGFHPCLLSSSLLILSFKLPST